MADSLKLFKKFSTQMNLFALIVMVIFASVVRPPEIITDIEVLGDHLYVAFGERGIRVLNISKPGLPREVGKYDTFDSANALSLREDGDKEFLYVADGKAGVLAFEVTNHDDPVNLWDLKKFANAKDIVIQDKYAFVARGADGVTILNLNKNIEADDFSVDIPIELGAERVAVTAEYLCVLDAENKLNIIKIKKQNQMKEGEVFTYSIEAQVNDLTVYHDKMFIATEGAGLLVVNLQNPADIPERQQHNEFESVQSVAVHGGFAYLSVTEKGIRAIDISDLDEMVTIGETEEDIDLHTPQKVFWRNDYLLRVNQIANFFFIKFRANKYLVKFGDEFFFYPRIFSLLMKHCQ